MFSPEPRKEPRTPSGARKPTIVGTPVRLPMTPANDRRTAPMRVPRTMAAIAAFVLKPGTRSAPATITRRLTARSPQRMAKSNERRRRWSGGTGWMPQLSTSARPSVVVAM